MAAAEPRTARPWQAERCQDPRLMQRRPEPRRGRATFEPVTLWNESFVRRADERDALLQFAQPRRAVSDTQRATVPPPKAVCPPILREAPDAHDGAPFTRVRRIHDSPRGATQHFGPDRQTKWHDRVPRQNWFCTRAAPRVDDATRVRVIPANGHRHVPSARLQEIASGPLDARGVDARRVMTPAPALSSSRAVSRKEAW